jgi:hypothetical protein
MDSIHVTNFQPREARFLRGVAEKFADPACRIEAALILEGHLVIKAKKDGTPMFIPQPSLDTALAKAAPHHHD